MAKKKGKQIRVYLPRSMVDANTVIAIEVAAEAWGVSFGKALERMLDESESLVKVMDIVREKLREIQEEFDVKEQPLQSEPSEGKISEALGIDIFKVYP